jgi:diguanylate cyclase (GGDEF)-like protein/PAS domain S-box-containing protein
LKYHLKSVRRISEAPQPADDRRFKTLAANAPWMIFETDVDGAWTFVNDAWCTITGLDAASSVGDGWTMAIQREDRPVVFSTWCQAIAAHARFRYEHRILRADRNEMWVRTDCVPVLADDGTMLGYVGTAEDITIFRREQLRAQAPSARETNAGYFHHDGFDIRLVSALDKAQMSHASFALVYLDVDGLRSLSEQHGVAVGEEATELIGRRLETIARAADGVLRLGGDEVALLIGEPESPAIFGVMLNKLRHVFDQPLQVGDCTLRIGCSVGAAMYPNDGVDARGLITLAETRMHANKRARRRAGQVSAPVLKLSVDR